MGYFKLLQRTIETGELPTRIDLPPHYTNVIATKALKASQVTVTVTCRNCKTSYDYPEEPRVKKSVKGLVQWVPAKSASETAGLEWETLEVKRSVEVCMECR